MCVSLCWLRRDGVMEVQALTTGDAPAADGAHSPRVLLEPIRDTAFLTKLQADPLTTLEALTTQGDGALDSPALLLVVQVALRAGAGSLRADTMAALNTFGPQLLRVPSIVTCIQDALSSTRLVAREGALELLVHIGPAVLDTPSLLGGLVSAFTAFTAHDTREQALGVLCALGAPVFSQPALVAAVAACLNAAGDVMLAALTLVHAWTDAAMASQAISQGVQDLLGVVDAHGRVLALKILKRAYKGSVGSGKWRSLVLTALHSTNTSLQHVGVTLVRLWGTASLTDVDVVAWLEASLVSPSTDVQLSALAVLHVLGPAVVPTEAMLAGIVYCLTADPTPMSHTARVASATASVLHRIGKRIGDTAAIMSFLEPLVHSASPDTRKRGFQLLACLSPATLHTAWVPAALQASLEDDNSGVREACWAVLNSCADQVLAVPSLVAAVQACSPGTVGKFGLEFLQTCGASVAHHAWACDVLLMWARDADWAARERVLAALRQAGPSTLRTPTLSTCLGLLLADGDADNARGALALVESFGAAWLPVPSVVSAVAAALQHGHWYVRDRAIRLLRVTGAAVLSSNELCDSLSRLFTDADDDVAVAACQLVARFGSDAACAPSLLAGYQAALSDERFGVRSAAVSALVTVKSVLLRHAGWMAWLLQALSLANHHGCTSALQIVNAIGAPALSNPDIATKLEDVTHSDSDTTAVDVLSRCGQTPVGMVGLLAQYRQYLSNGDMPMLQEYALHFAARHHKAVAECTELQLGLERAPPVPTLQLMRVLHCKNVPLLKSPSFVRILRATMASGEPAVYQQAFMLLSVLPPPVLAIPELVDGFSTALQHPDPFSRRFAVETLARYGRALLPVEVLCAAVGRALCDADDDVASAACALCQSLQADVLSSAGLSAGLQAALVSSRRAGAVNVLRSVRGSLLAQPAWLAWLTKALCNKAEKVQSAGAVVLNLLGLPALQVSEVAVALQSLQDPQALLRAVVGFGPGVLDYPFVVSAVFAALSSAGCKAPALRVLAHCGAALLAVPDLVACLSRLVSDGDAEVRHCAWEVMLSLDEDCCGSEMLLATLAEALRSPIHHTRQFAVMFTSRLGKRCGVKHVAWASIMRALLADTGASIVDTAVARESGLLILSRMGPSVLTVPWAITALRSAAIDDAATVRAAMIAVFASVGAGALAHSWVVRALSAALLDTDGGVRSAAQQLTVGFGTAILACPTLVSALLSSSRFMCAVDVTSDIVSLPEAAFSSPRRDDPRLRLLNPECTFSPMISPASRAIPSRAAVVSAFTMLPHHWLAFRCAELLGPSLKHKLLDYHILVSVLVRASLCGSHSMRWSANEILREACSTATSCPRFLSKPAVVKHITAACASSQYDVRDIGRQLLRALGPVKDTLPGLAVLALRLSE